MATSNSLAHTLKTAPENAPSPATVSRRVQVIHDIGPELQDSKQEVLISVAASDRETFVKIHSISDLSQARKGQSDVYLSSIRREKCRSISREIDAVGKSADRVPLAVATQSVHSSLVSLIALLQNCQKEANTREVLRQVRDTLTNGQWDYYKDESRRAVVIGILKKLANSVDVTMEDISSSVADLEAVGFVICGMPLLDV